MGKWNKLREKILLGDSDANIAFDDLCHLMRRFGFAERISGSHHIFSQTGVEEIVNLQPKGGAAKNYQVAQVRGLIMKYRLGDTLNE
jgi:hypothetical protein